MGDFELSAREGIECMELFSKGLTRGDKYIYGGFFWPGDENFRESLSAFLHELITTKTTLLEEEEEEFKKVIDNMLKKFQTIIEKMSHKPEKQSVYRLKDVVWYVPRELFKEDREATFERFKPNSFMELVSGKVSTPGEMGKRAGFTFLRFILPATAEESKLTRKNIWELRKKIVRLWKDLTNNKEVKAYLDDVLTLCDILEKYLSEGAIEKPEDGPAILKLLGYVAPFDFDTFESAVLLGRTRLFWKIKTPQELIDEIKEKESLWADIAYALNDRNLGEEWLINLLNKAYDERFLKVLRTDWKEVLRSLIRGLGGDDILGAFVQREEQVEGRLSYGTFRVPNKEIEVFVFYEGSLEGILQDFIKSFEDASKSFAKYTGGITLKIKNSWNINRLIPHFEELKKIDFSKELRQKESGELLFNLLYFIARLKSFVESIRKDKKPYALLLLLDTDVREENGRYAFWDYFALAYDFFSLPVQTLNKKTIQMFIDYGKGKIRAEALQGVYKNLFISMMKDLKSLEVEFEGFKVPQNITVHVVLEKPSTGFCYERFNLNQKPLRHYLYEAYLVRIEGHKVFVELEDKFIVLAGGLDFDRDRIAKWIEERAERKERFCFISAGKWEDSFINDIISRSSMADIIEKQSLFVEYSELAVAYLSEKAYSDCFVIYTSEFSELRRKLKLDEQKHTVSIALKPADPRSDRFKLEDGEHFYHPALQVFSTRGPGWEKDEVYMEKKSLFLLTLLAISQYESESFLTPYAKLGLWQKQKNLYITPRRNNGDYRMGLSGVLYELLYLASKIPGSIEDL